VHPDASESRLPIPPLILSCRDLALEFGVLETEEHLLYFPGGFPVFFCGSFSRRCVLIPGLLSFPFVVPVFFCRIWKDFEALA